MQLLPTDALTLEPELKKLQLRAAEGALAGEQVEQATSLLAALPEGDRRLECLRIDSAIKTGMLETALGLLPGTQCPDQAEHLYQEADRIVEAGEFEAATEMLQVLLAALPASADASETLGTLIALHNPEGALSHLRLAVVVDGAAGQRVQATGRVAVL